MRERDGGNMRVAAIQRSVSCPPLPRYARRLRAYAITCGVTWSHRHCYGESGRQRAMPACLRYAPYHRHAITIDDLLIIRAARDDVYGAEHMFDCAL